MDILCYFTAFLIGVYLCYETIVIASEDNRDKGFMRGVRYTLTFSLGSAMMIYAIACKVDWLHVLAGLVVSIRFLYDLEQRLKSWFGVIRLTG